MRRSAGVLALGVLVAAVAAGWHPLVAPRLTKMPVDLSLSTEHQGTYTAYLDETSGTPLPAPRALPLTISRKVRAVTAQTHGDRLVVEDVTTFGVGGRSSTQTVRDVLDRSTGKGLADSGAWSLTEGNTVDRSGNYVLGPPMGTDTSRSYALWQDEIGAPVQLASRHSTRVIDGVTTERWGADVGPTPMAPAYVTASGLPASLTFSALAVRLRGEGIDLAALTADAMPLLTGAEKAQVAQVQGMSIPLRYSMAISSDYDVEPSTGAIVDVARSRREVTAKPDLAGLTATLGPLFAAHADLPVVKRLLQMMAAADRETGQKVYDREYAQTPASVAAEAHRAAAATRTLRITTVWVPIGLGVLALLMIAASLLGWLRTRGTTGPRLTSGEEVGGSVRAAGVDDVPMPRTAPQVPQAPQAPQASSALPSGTGGES
jgi:hypothetical protein